MSNRDFVIHSYILEIDSISHFVTGAFYVYYKLSKLYTDLDQTVN